MNQFKKCAKIADIKRLMVGRRLLVKSGHLRFEITKTSFLQTMHYASATPYFEVEFNDSNLFIDVVYHNEAIAAAELA